MRPFKQHPTLDDLKAFVVEQDELHVRLRGAWRKSSDSYEEGRKLDEQYSQSAVRKFKRVENVADGRDLLIHHNASKVVKRAKELYEQAAEAEREAVETGRLIEESRSGRQMESYDYDLYLSQGFELPPHRRIIYERNGYATESAVELLNACEDARDFVQVLAHNCQSEPEILKTLRSATSQAPMRTD